MTLKRSKTKNTRCMMTSSSRHPYLFDEALMNDFDKNMDFVHLAMETSAAIGGKNSEEVKTPSEKLGRLPKTNIHKEFIPIQHVYITSLCMQTHCIFVLCIHICIIMYSVVDHYMIPARNLVCFFPNNLAPPASNC